MTTYFIPINRECRWMPCVIALDILTKTYYTVYTTLTICICNTLIKETVIFGWQLVTNLCPPTTTNFFLTSSTTPYSCLNTRIKNIQNQILDILIGRSMNAIVLGEKFLKQKTSLCQDLTILYLETHINVLKPNLFIQIRMKSL